MTEPVQHLRDRARKERAYAARRELLRQFTLRLEMTGALSVPAEALKVAVEDHARLRPMPVPRDDRPKL